MSGHTDVWFSQKRRRCASCSAVVGEVDEDLDAELDLNALVAEPLKPVVH